MQHTIATDYSQQTDAEMVDLTTTNHPDFFRVKSINSR